MIEWGSRLGNQGAGLHFKLMRWCILPSLDLEKIWRTRCLLRRAWTLRCYVMRTLMVDECDCLLGGECQRCLTKRMKWVMGDARKIREWMRRILCMILQAQ